MAEKKAKKQSKKSPPKKAKAKTKAKSKAKTKKSKSRKSVPSLDSGLVIVDEDLSIDQERVNEERRAYLEEARSQEAFD